MTENPGDVSAALLRLPYGILLVGSRDGDDVNLMTANWGTQCSFAPRLYTIFIEQDAHTRRLMDAGGVFTICMLPADSDQEVVSQFTRSADVVGGKLGGYEWFEAPETKAPVYGASVAWFECRITDSRPVGDHIQYVGEVLGGSVVGDDPAWTLQELGWEYGG
ncbi:MAG: flavin reductase family protein [Dehalococcoidia bacterium]